MSTITGMHINEPHYTFILDKEHKNLLQIKPPKGNALNIEEANINADITSDDGVKAVTEHIEKEVANLQKQKEDKEKTLEEAKKKSEESEKKKDENGEGAAASVQEQAEEPVQEQAVVPVQDPVQEQAVVNSEGGKKRKTQKKRKTKRNNKNKRKTSKK